MEHCSGSINHDNASPTLSYYCLPSLPKNSQGEEQAPQGVTKAACVPRSRKKTGTAKEVHQCGGEINGERTLKWCEEQILP